MKKVQRPRDQNTRNFEQIRQRIRATAKDGRVTKPFLRWERFWASRLDAQGNLPTGRMLLERFNQHLALQPAEPSVPVWTPLGPSQVPENEPDVHRGKPGLGRINCIAFGPDVMYAGAATGGLWKSTDEGASWTNVDVNLPLLGISDVAIHPTDPSTIYIGTGDRDAGHAPGFGVMKSTDGGDSFTQLKTNPDDPDFVVSRLLIDPQNPSTVLAAGKSGIYRLTGDTDTFQQVVASDAFGHCFSMEYKPGDSSVVYASSETRGVTRTPIIVSQDGGQSWADAGSGIPTQNIHRVAIGVTPASPELLYAIFVGLDEEFVGFYRSTDSGQTWSLMSDSPHILALGNGLANTGNQGNYDLALAVSPTNPVEIFVGGINIWKSRDGGKKWDRKSLWNRGRPTDRFVHPDQHALAYFPGRDSEIWACNDGGVYRSRNGGRTWEDRSNGLEVTQIYTVATSPKSNHALLCTQDNGVIVFDGAGFRQIVGGDGLDGVFSHDDPDTINLVVFDTFVFRSTSLGKRIHEVTSRAQGAEAGSFTPRLAIDPVDPKLIYLGLWSLFYSKRGGQERTWNKLGSFPANVTTDRDDATIALRIAPSDAKRIYVARSNGMFTSSDKGKNWDDISNGLPSLGICDAAVDPDNPNNVWAVSSDSFTGQVFRSTNAGATWQNITGPPPPATGSLPPFKVNAVVAQGGSDNIVYVGTDVGVFLTHDRIAPSWVPYNGGIPTVVVHDLEIHPFTNTLYAATFGRGLWKAPLFTVPTFSIRLAPNRLKLVRGSNAAVDVDVLRNPPDFEGTITLDVQGVPAGVTDNLHPPLGDNRTLDLSVGNSVVFGTYSIFIVGNTDDATSVSTLELTVKHFVLSLSVPGVTLKGDDNQLKTAVVTVTILRSLGFADTVAFSIEGLPVGLPQGAGVNATIDPISTAGNTSTLRLSAGRFASAQSFVLTLRGSSGSLTDTIQLGVDVLPSSSSAPGGAEQP